MSRVYRISIVAALAGFLFGFDTVVISGADQELQSLWNTSDLFHGSIVMSMALWGTVIGALTASYPCDKFGRKKTLLIIGLLFFVSAIGSGLATNPFMFSFFRFIGGIGVGSSTIAGPTYISEIAPASKRGRLVALYQFNIVFGILVAYISNYSLQNFGTEPWRWMIGVEAIPAFIYLLGIYNIPFSPRWLLITDKKNHSLANQIFKKINGRDLNTLEINDIINKKYVNDKLFTLKYIKPLVLAFLISFFNQLSGINAFLYYAPRIFETAGLRSDSALLSSIGIGLVNIIFTLIGMYMIDRTGRRTLIKIGSIGYIFSLTMVGVSFLLDWKGILIPLFLFIFIASHAIGQGAVIWVFISEIFPNHLRAKGQSFGSSIHWILASIVTLFMPSLLSGLSNPGYIFLCFAGFMVFQYLFAIYLMPETKNITLEKLSDSLLKK